MRLRHDAIATHASAFSPRRGQQFFAGGDHRHWIRVQPPGLPDVVAHVREQVPLDIVGMRSEAVGGLGEVPPPELPGFMARYRFFFHPALYTSLGLAVCEAMAIGVPVVGLATTELVTVIDDGVTGYIGTDADRLVERMRLLLGRPDQARGMGALARVVARRRFAIERFADDCCSLLHEVAAGGVRAAAGS